MDAYGYADRTISGRTFAKSANLRAGHICRPDKKWENQPVVRLLRPTEIPALRRSCFIHRMSAGKCGSGSTQSNYLKRHRLFIQILASTSRTEKPITPARRLHNCSGRLAIVALSLWLAGCNNQRPATYGLPAPEVTVSKPEQKEVVNWNEFTGRTAAVKLVTVTPRGIGYIVDIPFKDGDLVPKGDLLFQIDPRAYQDAYEQAVC